MSNCSNSGSVLITSLSQKVPLINAVRHAANRARPAALVYGGDNNAHCIGRFFVDAFWHMPADEQLSVAEIIDWCEAHRVTTIIPSRDAELLFWAQHRASLQQLGIDVMVSCTQAVHTCLDKLEFANHCADHGFKAVPTFEQPHQVKSDVLVVKERFGAGSGLLAVNSTRQQAIEFSLNMDTPVFQPMIDGREVSADLYLSQEHVVQGVVLRERNQIVSGESKVTTTFSHPALAQQCTALAMSLRLRGHVMFQLFIDDFDQVTFIECNCRFGGASTLSIAAGLDSFYWLLQESDGHTLDPDRVQLNPRPLRQVRYNADRIEPA